MSDIELGWRELHTQSTVVDVHAHPALKVSLFHRDLRRRSRIIHSFFWPTGVRSSFPALRAGEVDVLLSAVYAPEKPLLDDIPLLKLLRYVPLPTVRRTWNRLIAPPSFLATNHTLDDLENQVDEHNQNLTPSEGDRPVALVRSVGALNRVLQQGSTGPIALVHTVEGAHCLHGVSGVATGLQEIIAHLEALFARGVALLTLGHFYPNVAVCPVFPFPEFALPLLPRKRIRKLWDTIDLSCGLSQAGCAIVERMFELGMLVDVSHCTPAARQQIYQLATGKGVRSLVMASHVGAYAINPSPYNLQDWEVRWIADHGGVVGVIFMNYWLMPHETKLGLDHIARTIMHLVAVAGGRTTHVALGTDFDGFTDPPDDVKDASEMPRVTERLYAERVSPTARTLSDQDIANILGGNALRMLREGWGRK